MQTPTPEQVAALLSKYKAMTERVVGERDALAKAMREIMNAKNDPSEIAYNALKTLACSPRNQLTAQEKLDRAAALGQARSFTRPDGGRG